MSAAPEPAGPGSPFQFRHGRLHAEAVDLTDVAERYGTPTYVYSRAGLEERWRAFDRALGSRPHLVCFAVKANSNLAVLNVLARLGAGFDIVSGGELERVLAAGGRPERIVFSGVGKQVDEMRRALALGIRCFNVESPAELERLQRVATELGRTAPVSLRVNPDVDARTHPYIATGLRRNKFGIAIEDAPAIYRQAAEMPGIEVAGVDCHIGSQLTSLEPFSDALDRVLKLVDELASQGIRLREIDVGGGLGIRYRDEMPPGVSDYGKVISSRLGARELEVVLEPGRAICGNAGVLLTRVEYLKRNAERDFAIVDAAMNDFIRPALYDAWSEIVPLRQDAGGAPGVYDVVGPVCESGDFLGRERALSLAESDGLAVLSAGAYGFAMSSNYNSRPRAAEVLVDGGRAYLVRPRESVTELFASEVMLPETSATVTGGAPCR